MVSGSKTLIEFNINAEVRLFEGWLDRYRLTTLPTRIFLEEDRVLAVQGSPTLKDVQQGLRIHEIRAGIVTTDPQDREHEIHFGFFSVVEVEVAELAHNRLNILVRILHPRLIPYVAKMLFEVSRLWPETKDSIYAAIAEPGTDVLPEEFEASSSLHIASPEFGTAVSYAKGQQRQDLVELLDSQVDMSDAQMNQVTARKQQPAIYRTTKKKLRHIAMFRKQQILDFGHPPSIKVACLEYKIDRRTIAKHEPELYENWYDLNFPWNKVDDWDTDEEI